MVNSATRTLIEKARKKRLAVIWGDALTLDGFQLDSTIRESHGQTNETTDHPIEQGGEITDHTIPKPFMLDIDGVITNTPIEALASLRNPRRRANTIFEKVLELQRLGELAIIFTGLNYYEDMTLLGWTVDRDASTSDSIFVKMSFKQIQQVESQLVEAPVPKVERAKPRKPAGRKAKKIASEPRKSLLASIIGAL